MYLLHVYFHTYCCSFSFHYLITYLFSYCVPASIMLNKLKKMISRRKSRREGRCFQSNIFSPIHSAKFCPSQVHKYFSAICNGPICGKLCHNVGINLAICCNSATLWASGNMWSTLPQFGHSSGNMWQLCHNIYRHQSECWNCARS